MNNLDKTETKVPKLKKKAQVQKIYYHHHNTDYNIRRRLLCFVQYEEKGG